MNRRDKKRVLRLAAKIAATPDPDMCSYRGCGWCIKEAHYRYSRRFPTLRSEKGWKEMQGMRRLFYRVMLPNPYVFLPRNKENAEHRVLLLLMYAEML